MLKRLTNNWTLKLTSMVLAIALWSHVRGEVNPWETATFRVPLRVTPPRNMVLSSDSKPPSMIRVTLRGPRSSLRLFKGSAPANPLAPADEVPLVGSNQVRAHLDFATARKGRQEVPVVAETEIEDVEVIGVRPAQVELTLDGAESDNFSVRPQFDSSAVDGLRLSDTVVNPKRAAVFAPSSVLARVVAVRALADDQEVSPGSLRLTRVPLVALDKNDRIVEGVQIEPAFAQVQANVQEEQGTQQVRVLVRVKGEPADGFNVASAMATPSRLLLRGPTRVLRELNSVRVTPDISGATSDIRRRVAVSLPRGVTIVGSERVMVSVAVVRARDTSAALRIPQSQDAAQKSPLRNDRLQPRGVPTASREQQGLDNSALSGSSHSRSLDSAAKSTSPARSTPGQSSVLPLPALPAPSPRP